ncbi:serine/threonine-protein kinase 4 homolog B-like [Phalaenopsis equestris]|uniref:serine/threonine-protein kinase 4 homolog B-like n=1 Tax=Phalaenopsis equestris TaxID=78828 RepID=UPI0009E5B08D|nr:serine/threonine-protein kinase 4 homolog B-like [Phalaenopsis equestris]
MSQHRLLADKSDGLCSKICARVAHFGYIIDLALKLSINFSVNRADIWSFGITALELAHGHAPFSKYPPMKVLLMTLQNAPPGLDYDRDKKFSKSFKEMVAMCLVKDQTKRPTAEKLLKHSFFKNAKPPEMYVKSLLVDLPPLWDRVKELEIKDAAQLAMKRMPSSERQALSQSEYQRGVSAWNFDVEDLKVQASLIEDDEDLVDAAKEDNGSFRHCINNKESSISRCSPGKTLTAVEITHRPSKNGGNVHDGNGLITKDEYVRTGFLDSSSQVGVNGYDTFRQTNDSMPSTSMQHAESQSKFRAERRNRTYSDPLMPSGVQNSSSERGRASERIEGEKKLSTERSKHDARKPPNIGGPSLLPKRASSNSLSAPIPSMKGYGDSREDKSGANVVQIKGRFSVTSENVDLVKRPPLRRSASYGDFLINPNQVPVDHIPKENISNSLSASILVPHLQNLFQQTSFQQDLLTNLLSSLQQNDLVSTFRTGVPSQACRSERDRLVKGEATEREQHLHRKIAELEARMISLIGEMTETRLKQIQLQQQLKHLYSQEDQIEDMPKRPDLPVVL